MAQKKLLTRSAYQKKLNESMNVNPLNEGKYDDAISEFEKIQQEYKERFEKTASDAGISVDQMKQLLTGKKKLADKEISQEQFDELSGKIEKEAASKQSEFKGFGDNAGKQESDKKREYKYHPKDRSELYKIVKVKIQNIGWDADLNDIDVTAITNMTNLFAHAEQFNCDISGWDVSQVTTMSGMLKGCKQFNRSLNDWNVSNVTDISEMFQGCESFDQPLDKWADKLGKVTTANGMFRECKKFNQPLNNWIVSSFENISSMFNGCESFNQPLDKWKFDKLDNADTVFAGCKSFNQSLNDWDLSQVYSLRGFFAGCKSFNQPLDKWFNNGCKVRNMDYMFYYCKSFNQSIASWNIEGVESTNSMFQDCESFNQPLGNWGEHFKTVKQANSMFDGCKSFDQKLNNWNGSSCRFYQDMFKGTAMKQGHFPGQPLAESEVWENRLNRIEEAIKAAMDDDYHIK